MKTGKKEEVRGNKSELIDGHIETLEMMLQVQRGHLKPWVENEVSKPEGWTDTDTQEAIRAYKDRIAALECAINLMKAVPHA